MGEADPPSQNSPGEAIIDSDDETALGAQRSVCRYIITRSLRRLGSQVICDANIQNINIASDVHEYSRKVPATLLLHNNNEGQPNEDKITQI